ncbi:hypothetical protein DJ84_21915 [Halorubrum ezzemoulense]|nr:hypothetical protein DJ84_21915 [Halorubrum ezzemoulense]
MGTVDICGISLITRSWIRVLTGFNGYIQHSGFRPQFHYLSDSVRDNHSIVREHMISEYWCRKQRSDLILSPIISAEYLIIIV